MDWFVCFVAGKARLEPVGIILCAALMGMAALELILESATALIQGFKESSHQPALEFDFSTMSMLVGTIVAKIILWAFCAHIQDRSPMAMTLAVDHRNDVLSNL